MSIRKCKCHCCNTYGSCDGDFDDHEYVEARHYKAMYTWGENAKITMQSHKGLIGRRVKICTACRDALACEMN